MTLSHEHRYLNICSVINRVGHVFSQTPHILSELLLESFAASFINGHLHKKELERLDVASSLTGWFRNAAWSWASISEQLMAALVASLTLRWGGMFTVLGCHYLCCEFHRSRNRFKEMIMKFFLQLIDSQTFVERFLISYLLWDD